MSADRRDEYDGAMRSEHCDGVFLGFSYFAPQSRRAGNEGAGRTAALQDFGERRGASSWVRCRFAVCGDEAPACCPRASGRQWTEICLVASIL